MIEKRKKKQLQAFLSPAVSALSMLRLYRARAREAPSRSSSTLLPFPGRRGRRPSSQRDGGRGSRGLEGDLQARKSGHDSRQNRRSTGSLLGEEERASFPACSRQRDFCSFLRSLSLHPEPSKSLTLSARRSPLVKSSASRTVEVAPACVS